MHMIIFAAAMAAAFLLGAYVRKPFSLFRKEHPKEKDTTEPREEKAGDTEAEEYAERINKQMADLISYTGRKGGEE